MSLRKIREQLGLQQKDVASKVNLSAAALSNYESGKRKLDPEIAKRLAEYYGVSLDDIYDYKIKEKKDVKKPPSPEEEGGSDEQIIRLFQSLSHADQAQALDYLQYLADKRQRQGE